VTTSTVGKVQQVFGPVVDVRFPEGELPAIYNAIHIEDENIPGQKLVLEVSQHLGDKVARCVAMSSTDGLKRGTEAKDTGAAIKVPVGPNTTGRLFDLLGNPLEKGVAHPGTGETLGDVDAADYWPIHRPAPNFADQQAISEVFETGLKVIDLLCPFVRGGKIGLFGGAGVGKTVIIQEMIARVTASSSAATPSSAASASAPVRATTSGSRWPRPSTPTPTARPPSVLDKVAMVFGQMNEPPGARLRVALSGLTMAENFRDESGKRP
jgi:F-type H+-transporting ATPase subunit beta